MAMLLLKNPVMVSNKFQLHRLDHNLWGMRIETE
jgi:hypothetical protein